jgi:hypothetical protein
MARRRRVWCCIDMFNSQPPLPKPVVALFVVAFVAGLVLMLWRGASSPEQGRASEEPSGALPTSAQAATGSGSGAAAAPNLTPQEKTPKKEQIPMPGCWEGLLAFDKTVSMETFQATLTQAINSRDRHLATYLQERLTELVGEDASRALQVIDWAEKASPTELGVLMEALKATPAVQSPQVSERLLKMSEDKGATLAHRGAALDALDTQRRLSPASLQRIKAIALDETLDSVAWTAARTIGKVMKEDYERTGTYAPYWKELLDISLKSDDMAVRRLALEMPSYSDPILEGASIDKLAELMRKDPERDVREMAAFRLAVTEEPQKALEAYRAAFDGEHDLCVRWAMLRFAVRAAGADALPLVQQFAQKDPRLQQDYLDFKELYAAGTVDFARIWMGKKEHHECLVEEGAPH